MPSRLKLLSLMALFALPLLAAMLLVAIGWRPSASRAHGELLSPARPLGALLDERGAPLDWRGAEASWHLIVLGPERCDPRCAETAELLSRVWVALHRDARRLRIRWLGEPDRASRERLARLPGFAAVRLADGSVIAGLDLAPRGELLTCGQRAAATARRSRRPSRRPLPARLRSLGAAPRPRPPDPLKPMNSPSPIAASPGSPCVLTFVVASFGAYVRLSHAGLGCPDWPVCYGKITWPQSEAQIAQANERFPERPVEVGKAWREQLHRHLAATLGLVVLVLAVASAKARRGAVPMVLGAVLLVLGAIAAYVGGWHLLSGLAVALALLLLLAVAWRLSGLRPGPLPVVVLAVVIVQAMLGMWTVTWLLKPIVVLAHLMGGVAVFALLLWHALRLGDRPAALPAALKPWIAGGLCVLLLQIALGGWVSANYAALACSDFPTCQGRWWPEADFREGFVLWRGIGVDYEGGVLDAPARTAIHLAHRIGAVLVLLVLGALALRLWGGGLRREAAILLLLLAAQIALGIANVLAGLPLPVAVAHHAGAFLLAGWLLWMRLRVASDTAAGAGVGGRQAAPGRAP
ncbi:MAG: COX15/CtaA family protein [Xanthomonadales bacterium]|nr:COX15/CtaA family protein [Xanthomonadales bacterium]